MGTLNALVTGCAGFIGSHFTHAFISKYASARVIGVDNLSSGLKARIHPRVVFYETSITDRAALDRIMRKHRPSIVFHFAAVPRVPYSVAHPAETTLHNVYGTVNLLERCVAFRVKRFVNSSSSSVYGNARGLPTREAVHAPDPISPYSLQKYQTERYCALFSRLYGLDTVSLRYFNVFGPLQLGDAAYATVISAWLTALYFPKKKKGFLEGDGRQSRDFCFVSNVVDANMLAMRCRRSLRGQAVNIASGERVDLRAVKRLIERYTGAILKLEQRKPRAGDVRHMHADIRAAQVLLGYRPRVGFEEGLMRTVAWFKSLTARS